jgi:hypothetical protein
LKADRVIARTDERPFSAFFCVIIDRNNNCIKTALVILRLQLLSIDAIYKYQSLPTVPLFVIACESPYSTPHHPNKNGSFNEFRKISMAAAVVVFVR